LVNAVDPADNGEGDTYIYTYTEFDGRCVSSADNSLFDSEFYVLDE